VRSPATVGKTFGISYEPRKITARPRILIKIVRSLQVLRRKKNDSFLSVTRAGPLPSDQYPI